MKKQTDTCNAIESSRLYTFHGKKRMLGHPIRFHGKNALAYCEHGEVIAITFQEEIDEIFKRPDLPEYDPL